MNALQILEQDHRKVKGLFQEARNAADASERRDVFDKIDMELEIHAHIEETVFYPAIQEYEEFEDMVVDASVEHQKAQILLVELEDLGTENHNYDAKLRELAETVEHHIHHEEGQMFPKIREFFDEHELELLGRKLESAKGTPRRQVI